MNWRGLIALMFLTASVTGVYTAAAQSAFRDNAIELTADFDDRAVAFSQTNWTDFEQSIEPLPPVIRLERYQDLAFKYLADSKPDAYERLFDKYRETLATFGNDGHRATQEILDAFSKRSQKGDYRAAVQELATLRNTRKLTEAQRTKANVALAIALADLGKQSDAKASLARARRNRPSATSRMEVEAGTAYVSMLSGEYSEALMAMRRSVSAHDAYGMPIDTAPMLSSTAWMLQSAGYAEEARYVDERVAEAREARERVAAEVHRETGDSSRSNGSTGDGTPSKGLTSSNSSIADGTLKNLTNSRRIVIGSDHKQAEDDVGNEMPWRLILGGFAGILVVGMATFTVRKSLAKQQQVKSKPKPRDERSDADAAPIEPVQELKQALEEAPEPDLLDFAFEKHVVEDATEGLLDRLTVMVVDDNSTNIDVLVGFLEIYGLHTYYIAENGEEACAIAKRIPLDLILMDIQMPKLNGIDATKRIRQMAENESVPIVGVTAFSRIVNEQMCLEAGMNGFLNKPVDMDELYAELKRVLRFSLKDDAHKDDADNAESADKAVAL